MNHATNTRNAGKEFFFSTMLEEILDIRNVQKAFRQVTANGGSGGIDGMQTDELRLYLNNHWQTLRALILEGNYHPQPVRKVEIPKSDGRMRMLGIPTVIDRLIGQSISQWLSVKYEEKFSKYSYGFRPGRNAHQALKQAQANLNEGYQWIVELDLVEFFDRVHHDKLMYLLSKKIADKRTLKLIRSYLNNGIMENGVTVPRKMGTPQGSPLSPLLSNIILHELDQTLDERGHRYVRYADDCSIYVRSKKSAVRVMDTIVSYLEKELKLKVNLEKSKIVRPSLSTLLGFSFYKSSKGWEIAIAPKSLKNIKQKMKVCTKRNESISMKVRLDKIDLIVRGWINYFCIAKAKAQMVKLDKHMRFRLRMIAWKQWKRPKNRERNLLKLGINKAKAYEWSHSRKGYCRIAHSPILSTAMDNKYFNRLNYTGFYNYYYWKTEHQTELF